MQTVKMNGKSVKLFIDENKQSSPKEENLLYMQYKDEKGITRTQLLSRRQTVEGYIKKHGLKKATGGTHNATNV